MKEKDIQQENLPSIDDAVEEYFNMPKREREKYRTSLFKYGAEWCLRFNSLLPIRAKQKNEKLQNLFNLKKEPEE
jgi:hypothetical protein